MKMPCFVSAALVALAISVFGGSAGAQKFDKGSEAYESGDFATALQEWRPLAEEGDARAQYNLGLMYELGQGVPQDFTETARWYRLAAE